jgi:hypothetical protein
MDRATVYEPFYDDGRFEPREMSGFGYGSSTTTGSPLNPPDRPLSPLTSKSNFLSVQFSSVSVTGVSVHT